MWLWLQKVLISDALAETQLGPIVRCLHDVKHVHWRMRWCMCLLRFSGRSYRFLIRTSFTWQETVHSPCILRIWGQEENRCFHGNTNPGMENCRRQQISLAELRRAIKWLRNWANQGQLAYIAMSPLMQLFKSVMLRRGNDEQQREIGSNMIEGASMNLRSNHLWWIPVFLIAAITQRHIHSQTLGRFNVIGALKMTRQATKISNSRLIAGKITWSVSVKNRIKFV